ncbi:MAG TPA: copper chaperone CopZ [Bacillus sp. (in: firmicutes)]|uniref:copper chaperone CopZ n=1 Tax=Bacillus litorisediminis TaxID=2922713 RepID=UPI001FAD7B58|nr:copper chaperone CopZ [Bacillus litorisediminis]HWO74346.1 copper chaperone CopZ [Bacillus sp. (in: firmicutes)]
MNQTTLNVKGMSCGHCIRSIEGNVGKLNGVESVKVNLSEGKVDLTFDPNTVSLIEIKEVIEDQGYDIEEQPNQGESCH